MMLLLLSLAQDPVRILDVERAPLREGVPLGWQVRAVRGQVAPAIEVANDGGGAVLRIRGAGRAAWFYRELKPQLSEPDGALRWWWRVLEAPAGADLRSESLDDSPIRVYVVFGKPGFFSRKARIIFYSFGNDEPAQFQRASFGSDKLHVIRMDGSAERQQWREHSVAPFADYRRIWKGTPPPITAVGVMQDTDQTRAQATAGCSSGATRSTSPLLRRRFRPHPDPLRLQIQERKAAFHTAISSNGFRDRSGTVAFGAG